MPNAVSQLQLPTVSSVGWQLENRETPRFGLDAKQNEICPSGSLQLGGFQCLWFPPYCNRCRAEQNSRMLAPFSLHWWTGVLITWTHDHSAAGKQFFIASFRFFAHNMPQGGYFNHRPRVANES